MRLRRKRISFWFQRALPCLGQQPDPAERSDPSDYEQSTERERNATRFRFGIERFKLGLVFEEELLPLATILDGFKIWAQARAFVPFHDPVNIRHDLQILRCPKIQ